ncbi:unnamed protein product [Urochloa humidicola]
MEAATALLAAGSTSSTGTAPKPPSSSSTPPSTFSPTKGGNDRKKKRKQSDGRGRSNAGAPPTPTTPQPNQWSPAYNPWTGVVQAWQLPPAQWRPGAGVLGNRPNAPSQAMMVANPPSGFPVTHQNGGNVPPNLLSALHGQPSFSNNYNGGGDWFFDTGASTHMASHPGSSNGDGTPPL